MLIGLIKPTVDLSFLVSQIRDPDIRRFIKVAIVQKCGDRRSSWAWVPELYPQVEFLNVEDDSLRADECSAYLGYVSERYDTLSNYTVFVHADIEEHVDLSSRPNILELLLRNIYTGGWSAPFASIAHNYDLRHWDGHPALYRSLLNTRIGSDTVLFDRALGPDGYCCSHFAVKRDRMHLRDRAWYQKALEYMRSPDSYKQLPGTKFISKVDINSRSPCQSMMAIWQIIFGEAPAMPMRSQDPNLPLWLAVRNLKQTAKELIEREEDALHQFLALGVSSEIKGAAT